MIIKQPKEAENKNGTKKKAMMGGSEKGEWTTLVECIAADGSKIPSLVIFKGTASFK